MFDLRKSNLLVLSLALLGTSVAAQERPRGSDARLPPGTEAKFLHLERSGDDEVVLTGDVTIHWQGSRFQADRMTFREQRYVVAEGNVLVVWGDNRLFGTRMEYDLELDRGTIAFRATLTGEPEGLSAIALRAREPVRRGDRLPLGGVELRLV